MFVRRTFAALTAAAMLAVGVPLAVAGPAVAEPGSGSISSESGVLYARSCEDHPVAYSLAIPAGTVFWSVQVNTVEPDGTPGPLGYTQTATPQSTPASGAVQLSFCGYARSAGDYTANATLTVRQSFTGPEFTTALAPATFTMRLPQSKTEMKAKGKRPKVGKAVKFKISSRDEQPTGYFGIDYGTVLLQKKKGGKWVNLGRTRTTSDQRGQTTIKAKVTKGRKKVKVRALTVLDDRYSKSTSKPVKIKPRGR